MWHQKSQEQRGVAAAGSGRATRARRAKPCALPGGSSWEEAQLLSYSTCSASCLLFSSELTTFPKFLLI